MGTSFYVTDFQHFLVYYVSVSWEDICLHPVRPSVRPSQKFEWKTHVWLK